MKNYNYLIKSVILGHAVGDALGVPVEFCTREELDANPVTDMRGFGTYPYPAGTWSDDTSMSLCTLEALSHKDWNLSRIMDNFVKWLDQGEFTPKGVCFDVGNTSRESILRYMQGANPHECGGAEEYDNGNGSLMRIHVAVLYAYVNKIREWDWFALIDNVSALTHSHDRSKVACLIYSTVFNFIMMEQTKDKICEGLKFAADDLAFLPEIEHYERLFKPDFEHLSRYEIKSGGYVVDTLEAALWCILTTENYRDCVLKAVNLGEDTDTVAAIAGGLAGALYGYDAIPKEWLNTLAKRECIEEMCERAAKVWDN
ncbi:MAG: ADP-ribosylglycohydrolase family protein [Clostridia bacterium]|nr:ADP-ribosylglycohydrolase family protein [Clostridia bacterium]